MQAHCQSFLADNGGGFYIFAPSQGMEDIEHDNSVGFEVITTDNIDDYGVAEIIKRVRKRVGDSPVYLRYCH